MNLKIIVSLMLALVCSPPMWSDDTVIPIEQPSDSGKHKGRSGIIAPPVCVYDEGLSAVVVSFTDGYCGAVSVSVVAVADGRNWSVSVPQCGPTVECRFDDVPGDYSLHIDMAAGHSYTGTFTVVK